MEIKKTASREVFRSRWMTLREDTIERPSGYQGHYGVVEKPDFAVIAAIEGEQIYLVQQYRYPVQERFWELPQGGCETARLTPEELAATELREETGLQASEMIHVGHLFLAYGFCTQGYDLFLARGLTQGDNALEPEEEGLICQPFAIAEVEQMILNGTIKDATTVAAFGLLRMKKLL